MKIIARGILQKLLNIRPSDGGTIVQATQYIILEIDWFYLYLLQEEQS